MKLLIVTQAIDKNHPILGFFHRWVEEFAKHFERIHVVALQAGEYDLPENVTVHALGKEEEFSQKHSHILKNVRMFSVGRALRMWRFMRYIVQLQGRYDAVFVHMNPEYVVLAGWWWRLTGKKVGLWYTHKSVDLKLRIAEIFADVIFTASKESFRLSSKKVRVMGHGIDTDFWKPDVHVVRSNHFLSVGRLNRTKRHDLAIRTAYEAGVSLHVAGDGPERERLKTLALELDADVVFLGALTQEQLRGEYQTAAKLVHRSETGSLDKVVLEAAACGCPVDTIDPALAALPLSSEYVREHHSLTALVPRILAEYEKIVA